MTAGGREFQVADAAQLNDRLPLSAYIGDCDSTVFQWRVAKVTPAGQSYPSSRVV